MTTLTAPVGKPGLPTFLEIREAMQRTGVLITAIITGGLVVLAMLAVVGFLVWTGRDTSAIITLVNSLLTLVTLKGVYEVKATAAKVADQTNGMQTKMVDHMISQSGGTTE